MSPTPERFSEPLSRTLLRTVGLAALVGIVFALRLGGMSHFLATFLVALWFTFGGHWVELFYLNGLRPRLPASRAVHVLTRVIVWFFAGALLGLGATFTAKRLDARMPDLPPWWVLGLGFIALELIVHALTNRRLARNSIYGHIEPT